MRSFVRGSGFGYIKLMDRGSVLKRSELWVKESGGLSLRD